MRSTSLSRRIGRALARAVALALVVTASGCPFFLPTPGVHERGLSREAVRKIEPNTSTRADVVLLLGNPDERVEDDRFFVYDWHETHAVLGFIVAAGGAANGIAVVFGENRVLLLEFAPDGRVVRIGQVAEDTARLGDRPSASEWRVLRGAIDAWIKEADQAAREEAK